ncbi:hypothetical protein DH2020_003128 [Rehmannia glutinosa]|uniref:Uncharacterized protein n=1 Tax=Rehmannia glutinosa TaxID=99300 RepID=A0ABR0XKQ2_REHGL
MATETVVSDHSATSEILKSYLAHLLQEVEKEVQSEVKKMEAENVTPPKESVESSKPEESPCPAAPSAESEAKIEEKQIEPPVDEDVKDINTDEKPKPEDSVDVVVPLAEPIGQKTEDKQVEPTPAEEEHKTEVTAPLAESKEEKIEDKAEKKKTEDAPIEKSEHEPAEKQGEEIKVEPAEEKSEEPEKIADVAESAPAVVLEEKFEKTELPAEVEETIEAKDAIVSEAECKAEEIPQAAPIVEEKPCEQSEVTGKIDKELPEAEPVEKVEVKSPTDKFEDTTLPKEEETSAIENSDQVKLENPTTQVEEKVAEPGKIEAETEAPEAKSEEKSVVTEELVRCEEKPTEDAKSSDPSPELAVKAAEEEVTSRDINLVAQNVNNEDQTVEADKEANKEPEKIEEAEKIKETVQATEAKLQEEKQADEKIEEEKKVDETSKTDVENPECTKDSADTKKKPSLVKMVKQSLVKAKKAIIGKSQNSKTPASEPKDDGNK